MQTQSFNALVAAFLGSSLPKRLAGQLNYAALPPDAQGFVLRMLALMKRGSYPATDFTPFLIRALTTFVPHALPSARRGRIPPITLPGRHRKLDTYVASQAGSAAHAIRQPLFLDLGCGFPPVTTLDTARFLTDWKILGVDRSFAPYVVYDRHGHYACFDHQGNCLHVQTQLNAHGRGLNDHPEVTGDRITALFKLLRPMLLVADASAETATRSAVTHGGSKLIHNHIRDFEAGNLSFIEAEIEDLDPPPAQAIRCMNLLLYFPTPQRERLLTAMGPWLTEDGILITGFNHYLGSGARYSVYGKTVDGIAPCEFAFGLDNLRPMGVAPWYTLHPDDGEAAFLADLTAVLRADEIFWPPFNRRVDALLDHHGVCQRGADGFLHFSERPRPLSPEKMILKMVALWQQVEEEQYAQRAAEALARAGWQAWINSAGDIAVKPGLQMSRDEVSLPIKWRKENRHGE